MRESDEALMVRAGRGDRSACQQLVERHLGRVIAFAQRTLGSRSDAEDAAQDVFVRVWTAAPRWKQGSARFSTWLYRVAMNVCLDRIAKRREVSTDGIPEMADPQADPSAIVHANEVGQRVAAALAELPEKQRIALTLCHYQDMGNRDAAEVMELSVEAVESLLARGRRTLKDRLRAFAPGPPEKASVR